MQLDVILAVALAGAGGAVARYLLGTWALDLHGAWPWHTLLVNGLGCLLFGWLCAHGTGRWSPTVTTAILAGFFGAFTTFSAFAYDVVALWQQGRPLAALADILLQNLIGLAGMALGLWFGGGLPR